MQVEGRYRCPKCGHAIWPLAPTCELAPEGTADPRALTGDVPELGLLAVRAEGRAFAAGPFAYSQEPGRLLSVVWEAVNAMFSYMWACDREFITTSLLEQYRRQEEAWGWLEEVQLKQRRLEQQQPSTAAAAALSVGLTWLAHALGAKLDRLRSQRPNPAGAAYLLETRAQLGAWCAEVGRLAFDVLGVDMDLLPREEHLQLEALPPRARPEVGGAARTAAGRSAAAPCAALRAAQSGLAVA